MLTQRLICAALSLSVLTPLVAGAAGAFTPVAVDTQPQRSTEPEPDANYVFGLLDRDGDGRIDGIEARASGPLVKYFGDIDTDRDGKISRAEWAAYFEHQTPRA
ncbi:hypothetical protein GPA22_13525 [Aromatoleum toluvorans]|uniref:EF-hand domain-containing protein n=1 Tax=Aromatoleum toluvorans TaxID=92002 RepID=A0ABX1PZC8_9RHOO|nr:hypothetical protein [Aromatoleum toluvorans]NMG44743.1 hypothetical protein [Aromatoleum toluvorans]